MIFGLTFSSLRLLILSLAALSQIYLFYRARRAIRSLHRSDRFKSLAVFGTGVAIFLLFALNLYILFRPIPWAYPSTAVQIGFFYPPAIWGLGSIVSALLLLLSQITGGAMRPPPRPMQHGAVFSRPARVRSSRRRFSCPDTAPPTPAGRAASRSSPSPSDAPCASSNSPIFTRAFT